MNPNSKQLEAFESRILSETYSTQSQAAGATTGEWMQRTYRKLHKIAVAQMNFENSDSTLSATCLIHEVFLRLRTRKPGDWLSERQFLGIVANEMKRVLIDAARCKNTVKRGGGRRKQILQDEHSDGELAQSVVELNDAIEEFEKISPEKAELVRLRYFLGLSEAEAAETMGISRATASRQWAFARAWLLARLS